MRRRAVLFVVSVIVGVGCIDQRSGVPEPSKPAIHREVPLDGLPVEIRASVAGVPSLCLVAKDPSDTLMIIRRDAAGNKDPGFMAIAEVGGPGHFLAEGVDSRALAGLFIVVGCNRGADLEPLIVKAFADAARRGVSIDLWEKTKNGWVQVAPPAA